MSVLRLAGSGSVPPGNEGVLALDEGGTPSFQMYQDGIGELVGGCGASATCDIGRARACGHRPRHRLFDLAGGLGQFRLNSSIIATDRIMPQGLARLRPSISGAVP